MNDHQQSMGAMLGAAQAPLVVVRFTEQEAHTLMNVLTQTALPYAVSAPLVNRVGQAIDALQNARMHAQQNVARDGDVVEKLHQVLRDDEAQASDAPRGGKPNRDA